MKFIILFLNFMMFHNISYDIISVCIEINSSYFAFFNLISIINLMHHSWMAFTFSRILQNWFELLFHKWIPERPGILKPLRIRIEIVFKVLIFFRHVCIFDLALIIFIFLWTFGHGRTISKELRKCTFLGFKLIFLWHFVINILSIKHRNRFIFKLIFLLWLWPFA